MGTARLAEAMNLTFRVIPRVFIWVALVAWLAVFFGLVRRVAGAVLAGLARADRRGRATPVPPAQAAPPIGSHRRR